MNKIASFFSALFSPIVIPTYGIIIALFTTFLSIVSASTKMWVIIATFFLTAIVPMLVIFALFKLGKISGVGLNNRKERFIPYLACFLCYIGEIFFLMSANSPTWLIMFMVGGGIALCADTLITLKWKISAHATGMGGLLGMVCYILAAGLNVSPIQWLLQVVVILGGIVGTSRLILERHTIEQIAAGYLMGLGCVLATTFLFA